MSMKVGDTVIVDDRGLKIHSFVGKIVAIDKTIEGTVLYSVDLQLRDKNDKPSGRKLIALEKRQISIHKEEQKEPPKKKDKLDDLDLNDLKKAAEILKGEKDGKNQERPRGRDQSSKKRDTKSPKGKQGAGGKSTKGTSKKSKSVSRQSVRDSESKDEG